MNRWGERGELPVQYRGGHRKGEMNHAVQRNSTHSMEQHDCPASVLPRGRHHQHYSEAPNLNYQHQTDRLNPQQNMRGKQFRWNKDGKQGQRRSSSMNSAKSDDSDVQLQSSNRNHHPFRDERNRHYHHHSHRRSHSLASDPLPSHMHQNTKLGSRWNPKVHENDVSYHARNTSSVPVEIVSTSTNSHYDDSGNDLSDGSPGIHYSISVDDNETSSLCIPRSKPRDANPQEDSLSLSPKTYHVTQNIVRPNVDDSNVDCFRHVCHRNQEIVQPILTDVTTNTVRGNLESMLETSKSSKDSIPSCHLKIPKKKRYLLQEEVETLKPSVLCDEQMVGALPISDDVDIDSKTSCDLSKVSVGCRVAIFWQEEGKYFNGKVKKFIPTRKKPHFVKYDDGDREWINFKKERFHLVGDNVAQSNGSAYCDTAKKVTSGPKMGGNVDLDWVSAGIVKNDSDSDTDDEEVTQWAVKMLGIPPSLLKHDQSLNLVGESTSLPSALSMNSRWNDISDSYDIPMSISEKVKLGRRNRSTSLSCPVASPPKKHAKSELALHMPKMNAAIDAENDADMKLRKQQARPLTAAEINLILGDDRIDTVSTSWVRRSVRQPSKSSLNAPRVRELLEKLVCNDTDMIVLKMKKYCSDLETPSIVIDAVLDALEDNSNCEALYIQNFNEGLRDEQILHLLSVLQRPSCKIWCLNIGETYKVQMKTWEKFTSGLAATNVTHMYASEHTITSELKDQIRETIRRNRSKHHYHDDPSNLDTIVRCTHCWWNPINAKSLRPYIQRKGYEHILRDAEVQGLQGTMTGALLS